MIMPCPRSKDKTKNLILETYELEEQVGNLLLKIDENKKKIQGYFDENNIKQLEIPIVDESTKKGIKIICKKSERATITYDVDKLKEKLDDDLFIEVTKRSYIIKDIDAMIKLMKEAGVRAKDFKALIEANVKADSQAIKRLYDAGEITMKTLQGTFKATISKSIKITEETGGKD